MKINRVLQASLLFTLIGLVFVGISGFMYVKNLQFEKTAISSNGIVVEYVQKRSDNGYTYAPVVKFTDQEGKEVQFQSEVSSSNQSYMIGETVPVLYNPEVSSNAKIDGFFSTGGFWVVFGSFGSLFAVIGLTMLTRNVLRSRDIAELQAEGTVVEAVFHSVEKYSLEVNGRSSYQVVVQWNNPADGKVYLFKSEPVWYNPQAQLTEGQKISVRVDMSDLEKYWVDLSFLPKMGN